MSGFGLREALLCLMAYLMGGIPFGLIFSRMKGVDLRKVGSGNIGATNVLRGAGKGAAALTLLGDILKGTAAVALGGAMGASAELQGVLGALAVLGHDFPAALGFRGGKGVATSLGVILIYLPRAGILTIVIWLIVAYASRYSSLGALLSFAALPLVAWGFGYGGFKVAVACFLTALLVARHHENIRRLLAGTERKIGSKG